MSNKCLRVRLKALTSIHSCEYALRSIFAFMVLLIPAISSAQDSSRSSLDELYAELDSIFGEETVPADLFALVDSLLASENEKVSALNVRLGYVSTIVSAGRSFGVEQYGITPAVNYFHHSGLFAGATGYWSNEYSPGYYLTNLSFGYSKTFFRKMVVTANHDFYLYNDTLGEHSFNKSIQAGLGYQFKHADANIDYAFLYGNDHAHRITATANARLKIRPNGFLDAIIFMPGASFQWGNANVFYLRQPRNAVTDLYQIIKQNDYPRLGRRGYLKLTYLLENQKTGAIDYFLTQRDYTPDQVVALMDEYYDGQVQTNNAFGFMNYSVSLPVVVRSGRWSLLVNYTYNVPQALPGETYTYDPSGYFSSSLSYLIYWKSGD
jgi:hypothetical protein